jgi:hypothetical protein
VKAEWHRILEKAKEGCNERLTQAVSNFKNGFDAADSTASPMTAAVGAGI